MAVTPVNAASLNASSAGAAAYSITIPAGTGILAGDVIMVGATGNGTHVSHGMSVQDSVNATNFTTITDTQLGGSSAQWLQSFYYQTPQAIDDGSTLTFTPYAGSTANEFAVQIWRGLTGSITQAVTALSDTATLSPAAPALGAAPRPGDLVVSFAAAASGTLTPGAAFTAGSSGNAAQAVAIGYVNPATGLSAYASTWSNTASAVAATQTVSFGSAQINAAYLVGQAAFAAGTTSTVVTVGAATGSQSSVAGDGILVIATVGSGSVAPGTVTDSHSQAYNPVGTFAPGNGLCSYIYALYNSGSALSAVTPDTVTVNWGSSSNQKGVTVAGVPNMATSAALDQDAGANGSGGSPAVMTGGGLAAAGELALSVIIGGSASAGVTPAPGWTQLGSTLRAAAGGVYTAVAWQVTPGTSQVTANGSLGASASWSAQIATFQPAAISISNPAAAITIGNATPLPSGTIGVAYSDQLTATGGTPPYTWSSTGTIPPGLTLDAGTGGASGDVTYVGVATGPQGAPTLAAYQAAYASEGPLGCYKFFFSSFPTTWSGTLMDQITQAKPGVFCLIAWNNLASQSTITNFVKSIPPKFVNAVGFCWNSEPENTGSSGLSKGSFQSGWADQMSKIYAAKSVAPVQLYTVTTAYTLYYQNGGDNSWIPPTTFTDVYGIDGYDRAAYWAGQDMSSSKWWKTWLGYVQNLGKPLALTEFGISGAGTDAAQNTRLQADWAYIKNAFGPGGSVSQFPLFMWYYWSTGTTIDDFLGSQTKTTWAGIAKTAVNQPGALAGSGSSGSGGGGLLHGTPTSAAGSPFSFTAKATDSAGANGTKTFSLAIAAPNTLAVTSTSPLPGATVGAAYSNLLTASGGTPPYSWATTVGSPPNGIALASSGLLAGTPTVTGTSSATYQVTDAASNTATAALSITVGSSLAITTTSLPGAASGQAYAANVIATGGTAPYTFGISAGSLPAGLSIDPDGTQTGTAGEIYGTPTGTGSSFTVQAADATGALATAQFAITVSGGGGGGGTVSVGRRKFGAGAADWAFQTGTGTGGGGGGGVASVTAGDASIAVGGTAGAPTVETGTLDQIATLHPPAANWSNNSHKITSLANGSASTDAAAFGQLPLIDSTTGDIAASPGTAAAGSVGKAADAGHVHPSPASFAPAGLTGAVQASRYVGATTSGHPTSGTFAVADYVVDRTGSFWICTAAGTPGTWVQVSGGGGGGFANPMTTLGDLIYGGASGTATRLAGDTSNTRKFLREVSSGGVAAAPVWDTLTAADVPTLNQNTTGTAANVTGTVAIANGGTGQTAQQAALDAIAGAVTAAEVLAGNGTHVTLRALAAGDLPAATTGAQGAVQLDGTPTDIAALGTQAAGSTGKAADAGHVHPTTGVAKTANNLSDLASAATARTNLGLGTAATAAIDTTAGDIAAPGTQAAGSTGKVADAGHVHQAKFTAAGYTAPAVVTLTDAATITVDASQGNDFRVTLGASGHTLGNPSNSVDGQRIVFWISQDATGSRTMSFGANYEGAAGLALPTLSTTASVTDLVAFIYNATKSKWCLAGYVLGFS